MSQTRILDVQHDDSFQKSEWRIQRVGWAVWIAIVIAALAGLLGTGPLSHADSTASDESLSVQYDRFLHYHKPAVLEVLVNSRARDDQPLRLKVSQSFLDSIQILRIEPEPVEQSLSADGVVYTFPQDGASQLRKILVHFEFEDFGMCKGRVELIGGGSVSFQQFVYP
ncbi:MAG TPA: hypothetical protein VJ828_02210 [Lacipirellulaceae bacterium]|nr:hypothetical protein [Lacipirellulaceae bacterium]